MAYIYVVESYTSLVDLEPELIHVSCLMLYALCFMGIMHRIHALHQCGASTFPLPHRALAAF